MEKHFALLDNRMERYKKVISLFAGAGFFTGVFFANTFLKKMLIRLGMFGDYFLMQIEAVTIESSAMFFKVLEKRMLFLAIIMIAAVISQGLMVNYVVSGWLGFSLGLLLSSAAMHNGIRGMGVCLTGLLPHYLLYIPAGLMLMTQSCQISGRLYGKGQRYSGGGKEVFPVSVGKMLVIFGMFFVGILLESFLNPVFLQKIYKIFNNM